MKLQIYDDDERPAATADLHEGDSVLLVGGGHGFGIQKDAKIIEVKLGPYDEAGDKVRFSPRA